MYLLINSPSTAVRNGNESTIPYEDVNINCAEVNATGLQYGGIYKFISSTKGNMNKNCSEQIQYGIMTSIFDFMSDRVIGNRKQKKVNFQKNQIYTDSIMTK